ncbi:MAG: YlxM family DNA-binding protein [Tissierellia bacterium]|nr:YlxM family DNA-binding protein [Tissierellia bacterium]
MVEKLVEIGILFDFYGKLLSEKQRTIIDLYYNYDLSLGEIGEELGISRQGVYDTLKRAEENLYQYEETLKLVHRFYSNIEELEHLHELVLDIEEECKSGDSKRLLEKINILKKALKIIIDSSQEVVN